MTITPFASYAPGLEPATPELDTIPGRKYLKVAEWLGGRATGQRTVRWFKDMTTGTWYVAESWKRPNLSRRLNAEQVAYVEQLLTLPTTEHNAKP